MQSAFESLRAVPRAVFLGALALLLLIIAVQDWMAPGNTAELNPDTVLVAAAEAPELIPPFAPDQERLTKFANGFTLGMYSMIDSLRPLRAIDPSRYRSDLEGADDYDLRAMSQRLGAGLFVRTTIRRSHEPGVILTLEGKLYDVQDWKVVRVRAIPVEWGDPIRFGPALQRLVVALFVDEIEQRADRRELLASVSAPAVVAYWRGKAALESREYDGAIELFDEAIRGDSTFALAGLELMAAGCAAGPATNDAWVRGPRLAWEHRSKMSERDRVYLQSIVGPEYPSELPRAYEVCP